MLSPAGKPQGAPCWFWGTAFALQALVSPSVKLGVVPALPASLWRLSQCSVREDWSGGRGILQPRGVCSVDGDLALSPRPGAHWSNERLTDGRVNEGARGALQGPGTFTLSCSLCRGVCPGVALSRSRRADTWCPCRGPRFFGRGLTSSHHLPVVRGPGGPRGSALWELGVGPGQPPGPAVALAGLSRAWNSTQHPRIRVTPSSVHLSFPEKRKCLKPSEGQGGRRTPFGKYSHPSGHASVSTQDKVRRRLAPERQAGVRSELVLPLHLAAVPQSPCVRPARSERGPVTNYRYQRGGAQCGSV